ncbi:MAG: WD repeat-containing protein jip5 [Cirrosporium novae-zelandiae]|nr:MAG: WD repeat-containing protein jip5 [Cirrosporium novae-zelandiae]
MIETLCTLPLPSDVFTSALHPSTSTSTSTPTLYTVGLASGHVITYRIPPPSTSPSKTGLGICETAWKTHRHKGSCRCICYSWDGANIVSAGLDGVVKVAESESGRVVWKLGGVCTSTHDPDPPTLLSSPTPQTLLLATDSSALHLYDLRTPPHPTRPTQTHHPHTDYISSLTALPPSQTSSSHLPRQILTTGGTTLAITDLRKGILAQSEDQEAELLSSCVVSGVRRRGRGTDLAVTGTGEGVLLLWERGAWDDQNGRIVADKHVGGGGGGVDRESIDVLKTAPGSLFHHYHHTTGKIIALGQGDGKIKFVNVGGGAGNNTFAGEFVHDEFDGVVGLDFEDGQGGEGGAGRMISAGGRTVKIWGVEEESEEGEEEESEGECEEGDDDNDGDGDESEEEEKEEEQSSDSDSDQKPRKRRKTKKQGQNNSGKPIMGAFRGID